MFSRDLNIFGVHPSKTNAAHVLDFLQDGGKKSEVLRDYPIWKTIEIGRPEVLSSYGHLRLDQPTSSPDLKEAFHLTKFSSHPCRINLVRFNVRDLGFPNSPDYSSPIARVTGWGFERCPPEVAFYLRQEYQDQPQRECLAIAMDPLRVQRSARCYTYVLLSADGRRFLDAASSANGTYWSIVPTDLVFVSPRQ